MITTTTRLITNSARLLFQKKNRSSFSAHAAVRKYTLFTTFLVLFVSISNERGGGGRGNHTETKSNL